MKALRRIGLVIGIVAATSGQAWAQAGAPAAEIPDAGSRLFMAPTGRIQPHGDGYVSILGLGLPAFQVGIGDWFSVGAGTPLLAPGRIVMLTPKVQLLRHGRTSAAAGVFHGLAPGYGSAGVAYAVVTQGTPEGAFTLGLIGPYSGFFDHRIVLLAGEARAGRRVRFLTENYFMAEGIFTINGVRIDRARSSTDLGVATFLFGDGVLLCPVINFTWRIR
jgi:hypothetical protein